MVEWINNMKKTITRTRKKPGSECTHGLAKRNAHESSE